MIDFIFMLTHNDQTIPDAMDRLETAIAAGITHIGFKDVGLPIEELKKLAGRIRESGATVYLEVVSLDAESEIKSAKAALEFGIDRLMGGTHPELVLPIVRDKKIGYYPFPGKIVGHPSILTGRQEDIVSSAISLASMDGVTGLDLLAYRWTEENVENMIEAVCKAVDKPVVVAGSIDSPERITAVANAGVAGFTIGTAALTGKFPAETGELSVQLKSIVDAVHKT
jgi:uncharacterized protein related to proFAR isomerase